LEEPYHSLQNFWILGSANLSELSCQSVWPAENTKPENCKQQIAD